MNIAIGTILKGRHKSNPDTRVKVWAVHPTNPRRVLLWTKALRFSWNNVSSLETNYEPAPADEPTWPDPTREPPADPIGSPRPATPVETAAAAPDPVEESEAIGPEAMVEEALPFDAPPPPPVPEDALTVTLRGETARVFHRHLTLINNAASLTGGSPLSADDLVGKAVARLVSQVMGGAL